MIFKIDDLTLDEMKKEIEIVFRSVYSIEKLVRFEESSKQQKINEIYEMLEAKKEELEKTSAAKKIRDFHKNYVLRLKADDKRHTFLQLDFEKLIEDNNFNSTTAYTIFMNECAKNNVETKFLVSDINYSDKGILIDDIEQDKEYIFIRDVEYKNFKIKEKSIIRLTGRADKLGNKEIVVSGLIYVIDSQGVFCVDLTSFFVTEPIEAKLFEIIENE